MSLRNLSPDRVAGRYTPTFTGQVNVDTANLILQGAHFMVIGAGVHCSVLLFVEADAGNQTQFNVSLPFAFDVTDVSDIIGTANDVWDGIGELGWGGTVRGDPDNNEALVNMESVVTSSRLAAVTFSYIVP